MQARPASQLYNHIISGIDLVSNQVNQHVKPILQAVRDGQFDQAQKMSAHKAMRLREVIGEGWADPSRFARLFERFTAKGSEPEPTVTAPDTSPKPVSHTFRLMLTKPEAEAKARELAQRLRDILGDNLIEVRTFYANGTWGISPLLRQEMDDQAHLEQFQLFQVERCLMYFVVKKPDIDPEMTREQVFKIFRKHTVVLANMIPPGFEGDVGFFPVAQTANGLGIIIDTKPDSVIPANALYAMKCRIEGDTGCPVEIRIGGYDKNVEAAA